MRLIRIIFSALFLSSAFALAQASAPGGPVTIFTAGTTVTAPQLLPLSSHAYANANCWTNDDGAAQFSLIVDASGQPRNIYFLRPIGDDLDLIALREVITNRFTPGRSAGQPVAIAVSLEVTLHACLAKGKDARGKAQDTLQLISPPVETVQPPVDPPQQAVLVSGNGLSTNPADPDAGIEKVSGDVKAPVSFPPTPSTLSAMGVALGEGEYKVSVVVDRYGLPERLKILEAELPGHEQAVATIVRLYRWKPAMKDGVPVPARVEWKNSMGR